MNILISGGAGFIGSNLGKFLADKGHNLYIIDNLCTGKKENIDFPHKFFFKNIVDIKREDPMPDVDVIIHLAARLSVPESMERPVDYIGVNEVGTLQLLEIARKQKAKFIFASSSAIYGDGTNPLSVYGATKLAGEKLCNIYATNYGVKVACLRFFNVFGEKQAFDSAYSCVIPKFINKMMKGETPDIYGDGEQTRDFIYVQDLVKAINWFIERNDFTDYWFDIGYGERHSVNEVAEILAKELNWTKGFNQVEAPKGEMRTTKAEVGIQKWLPDDAGVVGFEEGIKRTIRYYQEKLS